MGKPACSFKQSDVARAFGAARKVGIDVSVEVDLRGSCLQIIPLKAGEAAEVNEWDEALSGADQTQVR
jgi:hypothetical protein